MIRLVSSQPQDGEIVLHCAHALDPDETSQFIFKMDTHWFKAEMPFTSPEGAQGIAEWLNCCDWCYRSIEGIPERVVEITVTGHVVWKSDGSHIVGVFS